MTDPLRIGLIGAGMIGRKHAAYLTASPDCTLSAIADPSPSAASVAGEHDAAHHADADAMLSSHHLDGVIIAAPNDQHEALGIAVAARGLPMLVEKPIADSAEAAARLTKAAEAAGVPLLIGHHRRYHPQAQRARTWVQDRLFGPLVAASIVWCIRKPDAYFDAAWKKRPGGGPVLINLIHEIDLLRFVCGEISEVQALGSSAIRGFEVEDSAAITLRFEGGAIATVLMSDAAPSPWSFEQATGENHPIFPKNGISPSRLFFTGAAVEFPGLTVWRHDGAADWHHPLSAETTALPNVDVFAEQIAHFARVIRNEEPPIISGEDATRSLAATLAVIEAARTGSTICLAGTAA